MNNIEIIQELITDEDVRKIDQDFSAFTVTLGMPPYDAQPFALQARYDGKPIGYLTGRIFWGWLYIDVLWVEPQQQKSGIGTSLMQRAEMISREQKLVGVYCWTQSWQALGFYQKLGYEIFTEFKDFPPGHSRFGLRKYL